MSKDAENPIVIPAGACASAPSLPPHTATSQSALGHTTATVLHIHPRRRRRATSAEYTAFVARPQHPSTA